MRLCAVLECNEDGALSFRRLYGAEADLFAGRELLVDLEVHNKVIAQPTPERIQFALLLADELRDQLWQLDTLPHFLMPDRLDDFQAALSTFLAYHLANIHLGSI